MAARWRSRDGGIQFSLRLTPKGGRDAVDGWTTGGDGNVYLKARVAVPPQDGQANAALIALLAATLDVPKSAVHIVSGETARLKTIAIRPAVPALAARLENIGDAP
ncbi:MAG TPA: DUF167 family protein [Rhizomicrobium sp.]|jgi:uncharacterized protein YggU (UPF0235/DUF167 family)|nr:DUF167 family protein [Rhizomicrobium sp.]